MSNITVGSLVTQVRTLLAVPSSDKFFDTAEIIDWLHEGAIAAVPFLPEEAMLQYLTTKTTNIEAVIPDSDFVTIPIQSDLMRLKSVQVKRGKVWYHAMLCDYNTIIGIRDRYRSNTTTSYTDFYYAFGPTQRIVIFPPAISAVETTYFRLPLKRTVNEYADYPALIIPLVVQYALYKGKTKDTARIAEAPGHYNLFISMLTGLRSGISSQVPPTVGVTPYEAQRGR